MNIEILIQKLIKHYNIKTITELAEKLSTTQSTISGWRSRNAIGALVEKVAEENPEILSILFTNDHSQINNFQNSTLSGNATGVEIGSSNKISLSANQESDLLPCDDFARTLFKELCKKYQDDQNKLHTLLFQMIQSKE